MVNAKNCLEESSKGMAMNPLLISNVLYRTLQWSLTRLVSMDPWNTDSFLHCLLRGLRSRQNRFSEESFLDTAMRAEFH